MAVQTTRHSEVAQVALPDLVRQLTDVVGAALVAVMARAPSAQDGEQWARGVQTPDAAVERRLRDAQRVVQALAQVEAPDVIRGWLIGMNPVLEDQAPALFLADDPAEVLLAARIFVAGGTGALDRYRRSVRPRVRCIGLAAGLTLSPGYTGISLDAGASMNRSGASV